MAKGRATSGTGTAIIPSGGVRHEHHDVRPFLRRLLLRLSACRRRELQSAQCETKRRYQKISSLP